MRLVDLVAKKTGEKSERKVIEKMLKCETELVKTMCEGEWEDRVEKWKQWMQGGDMIYKIAVLDNMVRELWSVAMGKASIVDFVHLSTMAACMVQYVETGDIE